MHITVFYDVVPASQPGCPTGELPRSNQVVVADGKIVSVSGMLDTSNETLGENFEEQNLWEIPHAIWLSVPESGFIARKEISLSETPTLQKIIFTRVTEEKKLGLIGKLLKAHVLAAVIDIAQTFYND